MRTDKAFARFIADAERLAIRDKAEQARLCRLAQEGDKGARRRLIEGMILWVARAVARAPFTSPLLEPLELVSIGLYGAPTGGKALHGGVNRAIDLWDPKRGVPFHIFSTPQIMTALRRACWRDAVVRIPQKALKRGERAPMTAIGPLNLPALAPSPEEALEWAELEQAVGRLPRAQQAIIRTRFGLTGAMRVEAPATEDREINAVTLGRKLGTNGAEIEAQEEAALDALYLELGS